mmetsp:Transcript_17813/g.47910  ORF Transcript_17813/g.47910 Transcript_17813/m.47910 type:complete len:326 (+) Transcript_17813:172-1149(+)
MARLSQPTTSRRADVELTQRGKLVLSACASAASVLLATRISWTTLSLIALLSSLLYVGAIRTRGPRGSPASSVQTEPDAASPLVAILSPHGSDGDGHHISGRPWNPRPLGLKLHRTCTMTESLLSPAECARIVEACEARGWSSLGPGRVPGYREYDRIMFKDLVAARLLYARLLKSIPDRYVDAAGQEWKPMGLNEVIRMSKYVPGGVFEPHRDTCLRREFASLGGDEMDRSWLTVLIYLNTLTLDEGGETCFPLGLASSAEPPTDAGDDLMPADKEIRVRPIAGHALVFDHSLMHRGDVVRNGFKYLLRTDVCFAKIPPLSGDE